MANHRAIAAIGAALTGLISDRFPRNEFGPAEFKAYQPKDFEQPMNVGFSVFLFRVSINGSVRNRGQRARADGTRFLPSLPLDLHFLITPWAADAERQQRMLGWMMRLFEDVGQLSASQINHYMGNAPIFQPAESLDVICDPLALADYLTLWERLKQLPPSATYVARMVLIDSDVATPSGEPVQVRRFEMSGVA